MHYNSDPPLLVDIYSALTILVYFVRQTTKQNNKIMNKIRHCTKRHNNNINFYTKVSGSIRSILCYYAKQLQCFASWGEN